MAQKGVTDCRSSSIIKPLLRHVVSNNITKQLLYRVRIAQPRRTLDFVAQRKYPQLRLFRVVHRSQRYFAACRHANCAIADIKNHARNATFFPADFTDFTIWNTRTTLMQKAIPLYPPQPPLRKV